MTEKPYTTATWSMETETWRHCIFTHQMKLQLNLMYMHSQPQSDVYVHMVKHVRGKVRHIPYGLLNNNVLVIF